MNELGMAATGALHLRSVNWEHGMLLTPEHFLRQERYLESLVAWSLRFTTGGSGLVGGGIRLPETELGAVRQDPEVSLHETSDWLDVSIARARGLTPSGVVVDVEATGALSLRLAKEQLAGVAEAVVYIVCDPVTRIAADGAPDSFNPQMRTERLPSYRIALDVTAAERPQSLAVGRVRRPATGMLFEADPNYIPPCLTLAAHSDLISGSRRLVDAVNRLASAYAELHRAMREFMVIFTERGLETEVDRDSMQFAERMVLELQDTAYALLDRTQSPENFFARLRRTLHSAAIFFDLATGMQQYYETLRESGESEFVGLIELQKQMLQMGRTLKLDDNLAVELRRAGQALTALEKLELALEGKYVDFRRSSTLESANFIFDRGGKALYRLAARPSRVQGIADEMTIFFANLRLEGRDRYRLILVGDRTTPWLRGTAIGVEVRINEGSGFRRESLILSGEARLEEQNNLELDFEAPDVPTITDLRVTVPSYHTVHTALLFTRHRFYAGARESAEARVIERDGASSEQARPATSAAYGNGFAAAGSRSPGATGTGIAPAAGVGTVAAAGTTTNTNSGGGETLPATSLEEQGGTQPPWMPRETKANGNQAAPVRRRRLE